jgi:hypothetical protein
MMLFWQTTTRSPQVRTCAPLPTVESTEYLLLSTREVQVFDRRSLGNRMEARGAATNSRHFLTSLPNCALRLADMRQVFGLAMRLTSGQTFISS